MFVITVSESLKRGKTAGPLVVLGHLSIEIFMILAILLGLDILLGTTQAIMIISYIGGATLVLMGAYLIKTAKSFKVDMDINPKERFTSHGLFAAGILSSGSNPHFFLWWFTIGVPLMMLSLSTSGIAGLIAFFLGHAAGDLIWFGFVSYSVDKGRRYLNQRVVQLILLGSAIFLIIFGLYLICSAYIT